MQWKNYPLSSLLGVFCSSFYYSGNFVYPAQKDQNVSSFLRRILYIENNTNFWATYSKAKRIQFHTMYLIVYHYENSNVRHGIQSSRFGRSRFPLRSACSSAGSEIICRAPEEHHNSPSTAKKSYEQQYLNNWSIVEIICKKLDVDSG